MEEHVQQISYTDFGTTAKRVVEAIQMLGALTLQDIIKETGYDQFDIKNILIILIKHNCIGIKAKAQEDLHDDI